jgi:hypothetical protein
VERCLIQYGLNMPTTEQDLDPIIVYPISVLPQEGGESITRYAPQ